MLVVMIITVVNWWLCDGDSGTNHWTHCSTSDTCRILVILCSRCCVSESCSDNCKSCGGRSTNWCNNCSCGTRVVFVLVAD